MRALLIDQGLDRSTLAAARALREDGWEVGVGSPFPSIAGRSRAVSWQHEVPPPEAGADVLVRAVRRAVDERGYEIVFTADDAGVIGLVRLREEVGAVVPYPAEDVLLRGLDKGELTRLAADVGLGVPETAEATPEAIAHARWPRVVKSALHSTLQAGAPGRLDPVIAHDAAEATARAGELRRHGVTPLLQEVLTGELVAVSIVADGDARVVARLQQVARRTWPPDVGVSARAVTVPVDRGLAERVDELVARLRWFGLAQLQFIAGADGVPRLLDLNPRFYGSLALARAAGLNLPGLWARLATGREPRGGGEARPGATYQWFPHDLRASHAAGGPRGVLEAVRVAGGAAHSIWSAHDPRPMAWYGLQVGRALRWSLWGRWTARS